MDQSALIMAFIHVMYASIHKLKNDYGRFLSVFLKMKFKMKMGYSCMKNGFVL